MYKILIALSIGLILLSSCNSENKKNTDVESFTINGHVSNSNSSTIYLLDSNNVKIDSSEVVENSFLIKGNLATPKMYNLQLKDQKKTHAIVLENSLYNVFVNDEMLTISGGILNAKQVRFNSLKDQLNSKKLVLVDAFVLGKITSNVLKKSIQKLNTQQKKLATNYLIDNADNILSTSLFSSTNNYSLKELNNIKSNSKIADNSPFIVLLDKEITKIKSKPVVAIKPVVEVKKVAKVKKVERKAAILFSGDGLNNDLVSLKEIIKGKKITLVDFWASWCTPCREATPKIRQLYKKYKNKGFTVVTVSEDKNKEDWKTGIEQDNMLDWHHIFDDYGRISSMHGVRAIPYMILIDGEGKIIKEKASLYELERLLINLK
ncbi:TlpA disulfide reductase family protein [uncultured Polaribacter sp.]|uniref:TlpA disulfide reductase family protein n=1 Tax=uncultured Polaribacter sp. TaxID=174711 RepID=UPI00262C051F|nr:TlpA disulfide reductase family protein [uncultured Polaribacter sp.]